MTTHFILETVGHENWKYLIKRDFKLQDRIGSQKTRKNKKLQPTCGVILSQWLSLYNVYVFNCVFRIPYLTFDIIILQYKFCQDARYTVNRIADVMMISVHNNMTHKQHNFVAFLPHYLLCLYTVNNTRNNPSTTTRMTTTTIILWAARTQTHFVLFI